MNGTTYKINWQKERRASSRHTSWNDLAVFKPKLIIIKLEQFALCVQCQLEAWRSDS